VAPACFPYDSGSGNSEEAVTAAYINKRHARA